MRPGRGPVDPGAGFGLALLLAWTLLAASGFWVVVFAPAKAALLRGTAAGAAVPYEAWMQTQLGASPAGAVVVLDARACACESARLTALAARLSRAGIRVVDAPAELPDGVEVAAFDARGALRYAGPVHSPVLCAGERSPAEFFLGAPAAAALVLPSRCVCEGRIPSA
jgi:hypothetical protein